MPSENKKAGQLNNEGILFYNNGQFEEALKRYNNALEEDPNFLEAVSYTHLDVYKRQVSFLSCKPIETPLVQ